jgi:hypothetical protein
MAWRFCDESDRSGRKLMEEGEEIFEGVDRVKML